MRLKLTAAAAALSILTVLPGLLCGQDYDARTDIVHKKTGGTVPAPGSGEIIKVVEENFEQVKILYVRPPRGQITLEAREVEKISHYDGPEEFASGLRNMENGNYKEALADLKKAEMKNIQRPWGKIYILFYKAETNRLWGLTDKDKNKEASKLYDELNKKYPKNIFLGKAMLGDAKACIEMKDYQAARAKLKNVKDKFFGTDIGVMAELWLARVLEEEGKYREAVLAYVSAGDSTDDPQIKAEARLGAVRCLVKRKEYSKALRKIEGFLKETKSPKVLGGLWAAKGDCLFEKADGDKDKLMEAVMAYLRPVVVYFHDPQVAAYAGYRAGKCFEMLKRKDRAIDQYKESVDTAGGGKWPEESKKRLTELGVK